MRLQDSCSTDAQATKLDNMIGTTTSRVSWLVVKGIQFSRRSASTWQAVKSISAPTVKEFREIAFEPELPVKIASSQLYVDARQTWLNADGTNLKAGLGLKHGDTLFLPMELTIPGTDTFHRTEAAPLSLFLDSVDLAQESPDESSRVYVAQCPLSLLPKDLAAPFKTPAVVLEAGKGDIYDSSLWMGLPPTSTPLHRDPNPNYFVQIAGQKTVRVLPPNSGSLLYSRLREGASGAGFGADERVRGEEMMSGEEKQKLEKAIWEDGQGDQLEGFEALLDPGDALFIPLGWWHAIRGTGTDLNMSVNWWFR